jgi:site-specific DNA-methyltransferase (adenine-specific)
MHPSGRWPANLILDEEAAGMLDEASGNVGGGFGVRGVGTPNTYGNGKGLYYRKNGEAVTGQTVGFGDSGGASRFFYCAKASRREREAGLEGMPEQQVDESREPDAPGANNPRNRGGRTTANHHPTVKPLSLMRYLVRLTSTPTGGVVLDPFMGSGTTGIAALQEGRKFIGIELDPGYFAIAKKRIEDAAAQPPLIPHEKEPQPEQSELL